jgi:PST family polysaccharide transporter
MFELIEAYSLLGIQQFAAVLLGFVRTKILAITLGPFGVGIIAQANSIFLMIQGITALGLGGGFTKLVAEYNSQGDYRRLNKTIITLTSLYGIAGLILLAISVLVARPVASWAFDDPSYGSFIVIVVAAGIFWIQFQTVTFLFRGLLHWREYVLASTIGYAINILITIPMVYLWGMYGAVLSFLVGQLINMLVATIILHKSIVPTHHLDYWRYTPDIESGKRLAKFIGPSVSVQFFATFASVFIRSEIIRHLGAEANGIYQAVWSISLAYMGFILNAVNTYGIPKVASLMNDPVEGVRIQNNGLRIGLLLLAPTTVALLCLREIWIPFLFSRAFLIAGPLLFWQFGADLLRTVRQNLNVVLIPLERLRFLFFEGVLYWGGWILLSIYMIPRLGIPGVTISYFLVNVVMVVIVYSYHALTTKFRFYTGNKILIIKVVSLLVLGFVVAQTVTNLPIRLLLCLLILVVMAVWLPTREEHNRAFAVVKNSLAKLRLGR